MRALFVGLKHSPLRAVLFCPFVVIFYSTLSNAKDEGSCSEYLSQLFERGINRPQTVGYHGTSLWSIQEAATTGRVPVTNGFIYFFPNLSHPTVASRVAGGEYRITSGTAPYPNKTFHGAEDYASANATDHAALRKLGVPITEEALTHLNRFDDPANMRGQRAALRFFEKYGVTLGQLGQAIQYEDGPNGVVLGFKEELFMHRVENAEGEDEGFRVVAPHGLPIDTLSGIEPLGDTEWKFFEALQSDRRTRQPVE